MTSPAPGKAPLAATDGERRALMLRGLYGLAALAAAVFVHPLLRFTGYRIPPKPRLVEVPAPLPLSGVHTSHDFLLFAGTDKPYAVSRICTHLGCRVNYQQDRQYIECPCHQSRFTPEGQRFAGPAKNNLPRHQVTLKTEADGRVTAYVVHL